MNPQVVRWAEALGAALRPRQAKTKARRAGKSAAAIHYVDRLDPAVPGGVAGALPS